MDRLNVSIKSQFSRHRFHPEEEGAGFAPTFTAEIYGDEFTEHFIYLGCNRKLWADGWSIILTEAEEELLISLFKYAIGTARYDVFGRHMIVNDGSLLTISYYGMSAGCWSPDDGLCSELWHVIFKVKNAVTGMNEMTFKDVIPDIVELTYKFKKLDVWED